jgi:hypothetical protein
MFLCSMCYRQDEGDAGDTLGCCHLEGEERSPKTSTIFAIKLNSRAL